MYEEQVDAGTVVPVACINAKYTYMYVHIVYVQCICMYICTMYIFDI